MTADNINERKLNEHYDDTKSHANCCTHTQSKLSLNQ